MSIYHVSTLLLLGLIAIVTPTSGSGHVHSQHAENVYLPGEHILTSRFDGNIYFTSSSGSVCFKHAEKKSTFHVGSPLLLGLIVIVTL